MAEEAGGPSVESLEQAIRQLAEADPEVAVAGLTTVANRAIIELHKIARAQSAQRRGAADWGMWAKLANAARGSVLQLATVRDSLKGLRQQSAAASGPAANGGDRDAQGGTPDAAGEGR